MRRLLHSDKSIGNWASGCAQLSCVLRRNFNKTVTLIAGILLVSVSFGCSPTPTRKSVILANSMGRPLVKPNSLGMQLVRISGGSFLMGDASDSVASPVHRVSLSPFLIGQFEVTNAEFDRYKKRPRFPESLLNSQPAVRISWEEAVEFCKWLSKKEKRKYRLPTEAEWEYAARGGLEQKKYPWGDNPPDNRANFGQTTTVPVGSYRPNAYGLFDMAGNINEWVLDWYDEDYYAQSPLKNPKGPHASTLKNKFHILRGGFYSVFELGCAQRQVWSPDVTSLSGFRVVLERY
jgi:formylglycine-generating enzyme required for sulfatase activity